MNVENEKAEVLRKAGHTLYRSEDPLLLDSPNSHSHKLLCLCVWPQKDGISLKDSPTCLFSVIGSHWPEGKDSILSLHARTLRPLPHFPQWPERFASCLG